MHTIADDLRMGVINALVERTRNGQIKWLYAPQKDIYWCKIGDMGFYYDSVEGKIVHGGHSWRLGDNEAKLVTTTIERELEYTGRSEVHAALLQALKDQQMSGE